MDRADRSRVVVVCADCRFESVYSTLRAARSALADHEAEHGHTVDWRIEALSSGVERAGAAAGVCGVPGSADSDSPLLGGGEAARGDVADHSRKSGDDSDDEPDLDRASDDEDRAGDPR